jgi:hypothetical protein
LGFVDQNNEQYLRWNYEIAIRSIALASRILLINLGIQSIIIFEIKVFESKFRKIQQPLLLFESIQNKVHQFSSPKPKKMKYLRRDLLNECQQEQAVADMGFNEQQFHTRMYRKLSRKLYSFTKNKRCLLIVYILHCLIIFVCLCSGLFAELPHRRYQIQYGWWRREDEEVHVWWLNGSELSFSQNFLCRSMKFLSKAKQGYVPVHFSFFPLLIIITDHHQRDTSRPMSTITQKNNKSKTS